MHSRKRYDRECKSKNSEDDSNISIVNDRKLKDNKKSSSTDDDARKFTIHWINSKDDNGCDYEYCIETAEGDYNLKYPSKNNEPI